MFCQIYTIVFAQISFTKPPRSFLPRRHAAPVHRPPHMLSNSSHSQELVLFVASLLKSDKKRKVLSGCLEKFTHGWSLGYLDLPLGTSEASLEIFLRQTLDLRPWVCLWKIPCEASD